MKRLVPLVLVLSLTACQGSPDPAPADPSAPSVTLTASATEGEAPLEVQFTAQASPGASAYRWTVDNFALEATGATVRYTFEERGLHFVTVLATTPLGTAADNLVITVEQ